MFGFDSRCFHQNAKTCPPSRENGLSPDLHRRNLGAREPARFPRIDRNPHGGVAPLHCPARADGSDDGRIARWHRSIASPQQRQPCRDTQCGHRPCCVERVGNAACKQRQSGASLYAEGVPLSLPSNFQTTHNHKNTNSMQCIAPKNHSARLEAGSAVGGLELSFPNAGRAAST